MKSIRFSIFFFAAVMVVTQYACVSKNPQQQAEQLILEQDYQGAVDAYQVVINEKPGTPDARQAQLGLAKLYIEKMSQPEQGVQVYQDLLAADPDSEEAAQAHWRLGVYHFKAKDYESAQKSFDTIVNQFPNFEQSHNAQLMLAKSYEEAQDYDKAAEIYDNVANRHPKSERAAQALTNKARIEQEYLKDQTAAKRTYQTLVKRYGKVKGTEVAINEAKKELELMGASIPTPEDPAGTEYDRRLARRAERRERARPEGSGRSRAMGISEAADSGFGVNADGIMRGFGSEVQGDQYGTYYDAMLQIAGFYFMDQNYRDAGALYFRAIELAKADDAQIDLLHHAHLRLSISYRKVGMYQRAAEVLKQAVRKDKRVLEAVITTATNQYTDGDYEKAIETFKSVAGLNRNKDPEIYWKLSLVYQKMGDYQKEAEFCERALAVKTDYPDALQSLAYVLYRHLKEKDRAGIFDDIAKGKGDTYDGEKAIGDICYKYGNYSWAKTKYEAAARMAQRQKKEATSEVEERVLDNRIVYMKVHAAMASYKSGVADKAQATIDSLTTEYPDHPLLPYGQGQLALLKGDADAAITAFKASMEKDPESDAAPIALGEYYISQGYTDEVVALWEGFLENNRRNKAVRRRLNELKKQIDAAAAADGKSE
ncbi:MAG: tetratricopeptide repeat protein [Candidatus Poribacteria bacterium]|nr:tetratricopeptide repeat protein [Candidatus Poribacteria bacterium]